MTALENALSRYRVRPTIPKDGMGHPFTLVSSIGDPARSNEVRDAWPGDQLPPDVLELWRTCREARLFEDAIYGQWGLVLLSPIASAVRTNQERAARPSELRPDDVIVGEFLGDQELVVVAPSEAGRRRVLIALPLDDRDDWFGAASSLGGFLELYFEAGGNKYWERGGAGSATR